MAHGSFLRKEKKMCHQDTVIIDNFLGKFGITMTYLRLFKNPKASPNQISADFIKKLQLANSNVQNLDDPKHREFIQAKWEIFNSIYSQKE